MPANIAPIKMIVPTAYMGIAIQTSGYILPYRIQW